MQQVTLLTNQQLPPQCPHCGFTIFNPNYPRCEKCGKPVQVEKHAGVDVTSEVEAELAKRERVRIAAHHAAMRSGISQTDWGNQPPKQCTHCGATIFDPNLRQCEQCGAPIFVEQNPFTDKAIGEKAQEALTRERRHIAALRKDMQIGIAPTALQDIEDTCYHANPAPAANVQRNFFSRLVGWIAIAMTIVSYILAAVFFFGFIQLLITCSNYKGGF